MPSPISGRCLPTIAEQCVQPLQKSAQAGFAFLSPWVLLLSLTANSGMQAQRVPLGTGNKLVHTTGNSTLATPSPQDWAPLDIDEAVPPVKAGVPCSLPNVLTQASAHVEELWQNLQEFSANERIEHVSVGKHGKQHTVESTTFTYVAQIRNVSPGAMEIDEYRNGSMFPSFPADLVTTGTAAHALIFHPDVIDDFSVSCEGLGSVRGQPAWQLRFEQRPDRPPRFRQYRTPRGLFNVELKGRAWIAADSYQVMRMETDVVKPIPQIRLLRDHVAIDYCPVEFRSRHLQLWLPETMDISMDFLGHRSHRRHSFSDFQLFWVDLAEKAENSKE